MIRLLALLAALASGAAHAQTITNSGPSGSPIVLCQSATAVAHTGDTAETALANCAIPAGALGASGALRVVTVWSFTGSTNSKSWRTRLHTATGVGGSPYGASTTTNATHVSARCRAQVWSRGTAAQAGLNTCQDTITGLAVAVSTSAIDTTAESWVNLTGQLTSAGETIALEAYTVELIRGQ